MMLGTFAVAVSQFLVLMLKTVFNLVMHFKCAVKCSGGFGSRRGRDVVSFSRG